MQGVRGSLPRALRVSRLGGEVQRYLTCFLALGRFHHDPGVGRIPRNGEPVFSEAAAANVLASTCGSPPLGAGYLHTQAINRIGHQNLA